MRARFAKALIAALVLSIPTWAKMSPGKNEISLRGQAEDVYYYPASGTARGQMLFFPGDGGWRGFAVTIAKTMADRGFDVYGIDTRRYLNTLSSESGITPGQLASDFGELAKATGAGPEHRVTLLGWSEGAGLALLAAAARGEPSSFDGLITLGLPENIFLAWRWEDAITYVTKRRPNEPSLPSVAYMGKISPLPLVMIQSTKDEYVAMEAAQRLFQAAHEPRRFYSITASDHRFTGNQEQFFAKLEEAVLWIQRSH